MTEPIWIRYEAVLVTHDEQIAKSGGMQGIRDNGLLESALARPQNLYHFSDPKPSIAELGAAYAFGIARNHAFVDGNKRTALVICYSFLEDNGVVLKADDADKYNIILKLAVGDLTEEELAGWITANS